MKKPLTLTSGSLARPSLPSQADTDEQIVAVWLHGKSRNTREAYERDMQRFLEFTAKPLPQVTLRDLQAFSDSLEHLAPASRGRTLAAVKSLLSFGQKMGYLVFNVGAVLPLPKKKDTLSERILDEQDIRQMLDKEANPRNHALLRLLYATGARVSEVVELHWRDLHERNEAGQVTIFGKGGKTRTVLLTAGTWADLLSIKAGAGPDAPVFATRTGKPLNRTQAFKIVRAAAKRAGVKGVSPHWLRHSHATHALENGAPIHLVKDTLGHSSLAITSVYTHARPGDSSARYLEV